MSLVGKLEKIRLPALMQWIASTGKSGRLYLTRRDGNGVIVFRNGKIIYAASNSARETLGSLLIARDLISEADLMKGLEFQSRSQGEERLGSILVQMEILSQQELDQLIRQQIERVIADFLQWPSGFFKFDALRIPDQGEVEFAAEDFPLHEGLGTDHLLLDVGAKLNALDTAGAPDGASPPQGESVSGGATATSAAAQTLAGAGLASLKSIMAEIRSPEFTGEITHRLLTFAQENVRRGVLFVVRREDFHPMGFFGLDLPDRSSEERLRAFSIPIDEPSVVSECAERREPYCGPLETTDWNQGLVHELGGDTPREVVTIPMTVNGRAVLVLYGDNLPSNDPIGTVDELELVFLQAGLAMEKSILQKRIEHYEALKVPDLED